MTKRTVLLLAGVVVWVMVMMGCGSSEDGDTNQGQDPGAQGCKAGVAQTGQWVTYGPGDDGALQKGVVWPVPRFTDNNNGTVTDNLTGLIWLKYANRYG